MLTFMTQWGGEKYHPGQVNLLQPLLLILFGACAGALLVWLLERTVPRVRRAFRGWRGRRRRLEAAAGAEVRARALMSELCPHGWRAQISLFEMAPGGDGPGSPGPFDAERPARAERVKLEWTELRDESGRPAVMREVWAATIGEALGAMVADRQTDETLEQIEQGAVAEGAHWPDPE